jgi:hypothetical protein
MSRMISEKDWSSLAAAAAGRSAGAARQRLHPGSGHDLYLAVRQPGDQRCLWYDFPEGAIDEGRALPKLTAVEVTFAPHDSDDRLRCEMRLESTYLADVFTRLAEDVAGAVAAALGHEAGVRALLDRLELWRRLLQAGPLTGLSLPERRGLYGELYVLKRLLTAGLPALSAVSAWTGPLHGHQDFQFAHAAIEVKTTSAKQPQTVPVASERELDPTGVGHLFLVHTSLDERRGGRGDTLPSMADDLRAAIGHDARAVALLDQLLHTAGLLPEHRARYDEPHYSIRASRTFRVIEGFPRITEKGLPMGVGDVRYHIQTGALPPFECDWAHAVTTVRATK